MDRTLLLERIAIDPSVCAGKPVIRGTGITVAVILDAMAEGLTVQHVLEHFPILSIADVQAALAYAAGLAQSFANADRFDPAFLKATDDVFTRHSEILMRFAR
jgi:uncharacterized protein (DUF433 family)